MGGADCAAGLWGSGTLWAQVQKEEGDRRGERGVVGGGTGGNLSVESASLVVIVTRRKGCRRIVWWRSHDDD